MEKKIEDMDSYKQLKAIKRHLTLTQGEIDALLARVFGNSYDTKDLDSAMQKLDEAVNL